MFFWLGRNAVSCSKVIKKRFSTDGNRPSNPLLKLIPNIQNFENILEDPNLIFVDKSLLIKDILQEKTVLITRPRRWGKSLNLQMIESFFQSTFSPKGMIIEDKIRKEKFLRMNIGREHISENPFTKEIKETAVIDLQGTVPVVDLTFDAPIENTKSQINRSL